MEKSSPLHPAIESFFGVTDETYALLSSSLKNAQAFYGFTTITGTSAGVVATPHNTADACWSGNIHGAFPYVRAVQLPHCTMKCVAVPGAPIAVGITALNDSHGPDCTLPESSATFQRRQDSDSTGFTTLEIDQVPYKRVPGKQEQNTSLHVYANQQ